MHDENGFMHTYLNTYVNHLKINEHKELSTIGYEAARLVRWLNHLLENEVDLYLVTVDVLVAHRKKLEKLGLQPSTINHAITSICKFYWIAESKGWCKNVIGFNDMAKRLYFAIPVTVGKKTEYSLKGLLLTVPGKTIKDAPNGNDVAMLKDMLADQTLNSSLPYAQELNNRNQLMIRWMAEGGLRREELAELRIGDIPEPSKSVTTIDVIISNVTKNDKIRTIKVLPNLIQETQDFIKYEREEINSDNTTHVFVSSSRTKKGKLIPQSVTDLLTDTELGISPHGLRRYALTRYACTLYRIERTKKKKNERYHIDTKSILTRLSNFAGHTSSETTLKFYVNLARVVTLDDKEINDLVERQNDLALELALITEQIETSKDMSTEV